MQHEANADPAAPDTQPTGRWHEGPTPGDQAAKALKELKFELLRSALYHDICQQRAERRHRGLTFANVLLGSGAIAGFGAQLPLLGQLAGVAVAAIAGLQLVWDFGGAAHCHAGLRRRFYDLLADLDEGAVPVVVQARQTRIFADEPPVDEAVNKIADQRAGLSIFGDEHRPL
ncbi:MAG: hypothetical protein L0G27_05475 [Paracoccus sp. (in: a-proteobacteria)]|nr:hypothetical protein [Paracoccus sp. (in: a-proteobacteria)]